VIAHLDHFRQVCGDDHISLGTDGGIPAVIVDEAALEANRRFYEDRKARGIAAPGEGPSVFNHVAGYNRPDRFKTLADDLVKHGWPPSTIEKLLGANYLRVCREVWGG
jgi:membrane dipeptidase